jgi:RNA polymerase sigma-70 factor (ECF subfamily)
MEPPGTTGFGHDELREQRAFLRRLARGLLGDDAAAEDVVQEAELRGLERGPADPESLRAWLVTVTRRLALNLRRARERRAHHERAAARAEATHEQSGTDEALEALDVQRAVLEAVRALDERERTVLWQRYYEDRPPREIAARLGLPLATVKTRLRRALERLRAQLDANHGGRREAWAGALVGLARRSPWGAATSTALTIGGLEAMKKLALVLVCVALVWLGWRTWRGAEETSSASVRPVAAASALQASPSEVAQTSSPAPAEREVLEPPSTAPAPIVSLAATLAVHATWAEDGTPAAGMGLALWPDDDSLAELHARFGETDAEGTARLEEIPAGRYTLHTDRVTEQAVELAPGETRTLALAFPAGLDVLGVVLDGAHNPVARAEVWLERQSSEGASLAGRVVARSALDGSFRLRALDREQSLGAYAPGFAPAFLERLLTRENAPGENEVHVTLVLDRPGTELRGRVLDPDGRPVAGARVALGTKGNRVRGNEWRARARLITTDADGRFAMGWLESDARAGVMLYPLHVLAEGYAIARVLEDEVLAALGGELVVRLQIGAMLEGRIVDEAGNLVGNALVAVKEDPEDIEFSCPFEFPSTHTHAGGTYALACVRPGEVRLTAVLETDRTRGAEELRTLVDGAHERWDLRLGPARVIRGRVVDANGAGLASRTVLVTNDHGGTTVESDATGAFVYEPKMGGEEWSFALLGTSGVIDQRDPVRIGDEIVLVAREPTGRVRGGFTDRAGRTHAGEQVLACIEADAGPLFQVQAYLDAQGAFVFEGVAPGRYQVTIQCGEQNAVVHSPSFDVTEGETVELDWLETKKPSSISVACTLPSGVSLAAVNAYLLAPAAENVVALRPADGLLCAAEIEPGRYRLCLGGEGLATVHEDLELRAGEELERELVLEPGLERWLTFVPPSDATVTRLSIVVSGPTPERTLVQELRNIGRLSVPLGFALGTYTVEAKTREGLRASGTFEIRAGDAASTELRFELR